MTCNVVSHGVSIGSEFALVVGGQGMFSALVMKDGSMRAFMTVGAGLGLSVPAPVAPPGEAAFLVFPDGYTADNFTGWGVEYGIGVGIGLETSIAELQRSIALSALPTFSLRKCCAMDEWPVW